MKRDIVNRLVHGAGPGAAPGFTLIEVLVTMVILAVGLLGIAALQIKGLKFNHDAHLRSQISTLAYNIADRMRLSENVTNGLAASYLSSYTVPASRPGGCMLATFPADVSSVQSDLKCWQQAVYDALPPGSTASISRAANEYTVTLGWTDRDSETHNIAYTFVL